MIPKIIHQIYWDFSENQNPIPKTWKNFSDTTLKNNPDWTYRLWDEKSCFELLRDHYPWFLDTYNEYKYPIQKVDSVRIFILYHYGGVYLDMDYVCLKNITEYFREEKVYLLESAHMGLSNAIMASPQKHPFWKNVFSELIKNKDRQIYQTYHFYILQSTGPLFITNCYKKYKKSDDVQIIPKQMFNPCDICQETCDGKKEIYCYTIYSSSWHKLDSRILNAIFCNWKLTLISVCLVLCLLFLVLFHVFFIL